MRTRLVTRLTGIFCLTAIGACAQTFDVASVKPAAAQPMGMMRIMTRGGPGTDDPGRINYENVTLKQVLTIAFDVKGYQLSGPAWLDSERFDITAKVPQGSTKEQMHVMLQNLVADRFKMTIHREKKEMASYVLTVGKGGSKMKPAEPDPPKDPNAADVASGAPGSAPPPPPPPGGPMGRGPMVMGKDGFPELPATARNGRGGPMLMMMPGKAKMTCLKCSMAQLSDTLGNQLDRPVVDMTGLEGNYEFTLVFLPEFRNMPAPMMAGRGPAPGGPESTTTTDDAPALLAAVPDQLGLKLDQKKAPIDLVVIDHLEKTPTEN
jgi:uncharacterized protein (TIGR03435 family)